MVCNPGVTYFQWFENLFRQCDPALSVSPEPEESLFSLFPSWVPCLHSLKIGGLSKQAGQQGERRRGEKSLTDDRRTKQGSFLTDARTAVSRTKRRRRRRNSSKKFLLLTFFALVFSFLRGSGRSRVGSLCQGFFLVYELTFASASSIEWQPQIKVNSSIKILVRYKVGGKYLLVFGIPSSSVSVGVSNPEEKQKSIGIMNQS